MLGLRTGDLPEGGTNTDGAEEREKEREKEDTCANRSTAALPSQPESSPIAREDVARRRSLIRKEKTMEERCSRCDADVPDEGSYGLCYPEPTWVRYSGGRSDEPYECAGGTALSIEGGADAASLIKLRRLL